MAVTTAVIVRGKAVVEGVSGSFDAILYSLQQSGKATQNYNQEIILDVHGFDVAWIARNEHLTCDWALKMIGDTSAHALVPATAVAGSASVGVAAVSSLGQPFLAPLSTVTFTANGSTPACFTGAYQIIEGGDVDLANTKVADLNLKLRRYANAGQNTLANTTITPTVDS